MWTRAQLKEKAKVAFKRNYWKTVLISLLLALIAGGGGAASSSYRVNDTNSDSIKESVQESLQDAGLSFDKLDAADVSDASVVGFVVGIVLVVLVVVVVVIAVAVVIGVFVINPLQVGIRRFFVSNLNAPAEAKEIGYAFDRNYKNIILTMFFRDLYVFLWSLLLVIPGIVKAYEYRMISYLLTENPTMTKDEAFAMSKQMMKGQKWNAFVLDLSFIGWRILGAMTFGIVNIFYVDPYKNMTDAALYEALKGNTTVITE